MIHLIILYQKFLSPLIGPRCRFYPSCSCYALESYQKHSFFEASLKTIQRLLKCNPWHPGGIDLP